MLSRCNLKSVQQDSCGVRESSLKFVCLLAQESAQPRVEFVGAVGDAWTAASSWWDVHLA